MIATNSDRLQLDNPDMRYNHIKLYYAFVEQSYYYNESYILKVIFVKHYMKI